MVLCNQGCHTHVYFVNEGGRWVPYNMADNEPHEKTCWMLKVGKMWGGYFDTIPIPWIKAALQNVYRSAIKGNKMTVDELNSLLNTIQSEMEYVMRRIEQQEKWNANQRKLMAEYKTNLVAQQTLREERKRTRLQQYDKRHQQKHATQASSRI